MGSELIPTLEAMVDYHNKPAFVPVHQYAAGTTVLKGEVGRVAGFRFVVVPRMMKWAGTGAPASDTKYFRTSGKYDVFPVLVVGSEAFTTIGFQTAGKKKFEIITKHPSSETADFNDPYGRLGFTSVQWNYGMMIQRPEWIGLIKTVAPI